MDIRTTEPLYISTAIQAYSLEFNLDIQLVASIIWQESKGNPWSWRFEEKFFAERLLSRQRSELAGHVPVELPSLYDEKIARACSYGLMQVLGETGRVVGFSGDYLTELLDVNKNLSTGCQYLKQLFTKAKSITTGNEASPSAILNEVLYHWNGSRSYAPKIHKHLDSGDYKNVLVTF